MEIVPPPKTLTPTDADQILNGELEKFNNWFVQQQTERGILEPTSITSPERGIVKAYLYYALTARPADP